jgi:hypothetical protein
MKKLTNDTPLEAGWTIAFRQDGRESIVVAAKGTFVLVDPGADGEPRLADTQEPLLMADVFGEDPATTAPRLENDYAPTKPECDVLLSGAAHAPYGQPVRMLRVALQAGPVAKSFTVTGPRRWRSGITGVSAGEPELMLTQPISYDDAFGGTEADPEAPGRTDMFLDNPVGRGFRPRTRDIDGELMPATEEVADPVRSPRKAYRPMAFGPLGRSWRPRAQYVGTYDQHWMENVAPMLPADFDSRYFQAAPADQRMPYPRGGEPLRLLNLVPTVLSPNASVETSIPRLPVSIVFVTFRGTARHVEANLDTILIEPDANRFTCTWRASYATARDAFEIPEAVVHIRDPRADARLRARLAGMEYFVGLGALVQSREGRSR